MMTYVKEHERAFLYRWGDFVRYLKSGRHFTPRTLGYTVEILDTHRPFTTGRNLEFYLKDECLKDEVTVLEVEDGEIALRFADGRFQDVFTTGKYGYWNIAVKQEFVRIKLDRGEVGDELKSALREHAALRPYLYRFDVAGHEKGLLLRDGVLERILEPGTYRFWKGGSEFRVLAVDTRLKQIDMTGQEVMTKDQVALRLNFVVHYRITDPVTAGTKIEHYEQQLYILAQLTLREYVGSLELEELLRNKEEIGRFVLHRLKDRESEMGAEFRHAGIKDVILPGDIREILNLVLTAQKKAQANIITRREETASTRSLLNTARLMDENPTLYRLKELEFLERVAERVGHISLNGGEGLLENLNALLARQRSGRSPPGERG